MESEEINVLAMIKGQEHYIFLYNDQNRVEMLRTLGKYAADPELSFSWYDAAVLSKKVREIAYQDLVAQLNENEANGYKSSQMMPVSRIAFRHEEDII